MFVFQVALVLICGISLAVSAKIVEIDSTNAHYFFKGDANLLVEFYAPWCGHCHKFESSYMELGMELVEGHGYKVGRVDITNNAAIMGRFGVQEIPSLFVYKEGETYQYTGGTLMKANVKDWALAPRGVPISWLSSPFGPIGRLKGLLLYSGTSLVSLTHVVSNSLGISHMGGIVIVALCGGLLILVMTIMGVIISLPHEKND